jgi:hypothetical protein
MRGIFADLDLGDMRTADIFHEFLQSADPFFDIAVNRRGVFDFRGLDFYVHTEKLISS